MNGISYEARQLWAKKSRSGESLWLPLITHLEDGAALARLLWNRWLSEGVKRAIAAGCDCDEHEARSLFVFCMASHDLGKATPVFQAKRSAFLESDLDRRLTERLIRAGFAMKGYGEFQQPKAVPHALASEVILLAAGCSKNIAVIVGSHHGKPPSIEDAENGTEDKREECFHVTKQGRPAWRAVREELAAYALTLAGYESFDQTPIPDMAAQVLLTGLVIMTDWIISNEAYFPHIDADERVRAGLGRARADAAFAKLGFLKTAWLPENEWAREGFFEERFALHPRRIQLAALEAAADIAQPGIFVLEAPMGVGKTEAALAVAEAFAYLTGRTGVYFALPTQATSDGVFPRMLKWIESLDDGVHSIELVHARAQFNDDFTGLVRMGARGDVWEEDGGGAAVSAWFEGRKKALLADFAVGTVDQVLYLALKQKHLMLRHLALANKVVVIDECHAYDAYMNVYLKRALRWLGAYGVPVILLSATLPHAKRLELVRAYQGYEKRFGRDALAEEPKQYPLITYTDGGEVRHRSVALDGARTHVEIRAVSDDDVADTLGALLANGGCAGIVVNTVRRAQTLAALLAARFGEDVVQLLHARFIATDRAQRERILRSELGKPEEGGVRPHRRIVVGTQVIEQSLDLDFDVMISDLCPMDLLLQRLGRLHRHVRPRPKGLTKPMCFVLGTTGELDGGAVAVYGAYLLMRTRALLPERICLPDDISPLVQKVYGGLREDLPSVPDGYEQAVQRDDAKRARMEIKAQAFRICPPWREIETDLSGWLEGPVSEAAGEAAVRDATDSLEVLAVQRGANGELRTLTDGFILPRTTPDDDTGRRIARESLRLPMALCVPGRIEGVIKELEDSNERELPLWQESPWIRGCLILVFDKTGQANLAGYTLQYDARNGLTCIKEEGADEGTSV